MVPEGNELRTLVVMLEDMTSHWIVPQNAIVDSQAFERSDSGATISTLWRTAMKRWDGIDNDVGICARSCAGGGTLITASFFSQPTRIGATLIKIRAVI